jgi:hypothetical protein
MPGYTEPLEPEPTKEKKEIKSRFAMPTKLLLAVLVIHAWTSRKVKGVVVSTIALAIGLLHMYDHLYRVGRHGGEHLFFLPKKEEYGCKSCM